MSKNISDFKTRKSSRCKSDELQGFDNVGNDICFQKDTPWITSMNTFPNGYEDSFKFLHQSFPKMSIEDLWKIHRWLGNGCKRYVKGEKSPSCEARFNFLYENLIKNKHVAFRPFVNEEDVKSNFSVTKSRTDGLVITLSPFVSGELDIFVWKRDHKTVKSWNATILDGAIEVDGVKYSDLDRIIGTLFERKQISASGGSYSLYTT
jgi:hypothetical protein